MAMTLRLTEDEAAALRARADADGRSMQEVARTAITQYLNARSDRLQNAVSRVAREDAELLDRLSR